MPGRGGDDLPSTYEIIITLIALAICTVTDIKRKEIYPIVPILLFVAGFFTPNKNYFENIFCLVLGLVPIMIVNRYGNGGDGDALMCGAVGFSTPLNFGSMVFLLSSFLFFIYMLPIVVKEKTIKIEKPFIPFISLSYIIVLIIYLSGGAV